MCGPLEFEMELLELSTADQPAAPLVPYAIQHPPLPALDEYLQGSVMLWGHQEKALYQSADGRKLIICFDCEEDLPYEVITDYPGVLQSFEGDVWPTIEEFFQKLGIIMSNGLRKKFRGRMRHVYQQAEVDIPELWAQEDDDPVEQLHSLGDIANSIGLALRRFVRDHGGRQVRL